MCSRERDLWETSPGTKVLAGAISLPHLSAKLHAYLQEPVQHKHSPPSLLTVPCTHILLLMLPHPLRLDKSFLGAAAGPFPHWTIVDPVPLSRILLQTYPQQESLQSCVTSSMQAALTLTTTTKWLLPWGEGKITTHTSSSALAGQALPTNKSFWGVNTGRAPWSLVPQQFWQMPDLTQIKPKADPDWLTNNTGTKPYPQQTKRHCRLTVLNVNVAQPQHSKHIGDTPEVPGSGKQGTMHCRAL